MLLSKRSHEAKAEIEVRAEIEEGKQEDMITQAGLQSTTSRSSVTWTPQN